MYLFSLHWASTTHTNADETEDQHQCQCSGRADPSRRVHILYRSPVGHGTAPEESLFKRTEIKLVHLVIIIDVVVVVVDVPIIVTRWWWTSHPEEQLTEQPSRSRWVHLTDWMFVPRPFVWTARTLLLTFSSYGRVTHRIGESSQESPNRSVGVRFHWQVLRFFFFSERETELKGCGITRKHSV